MSYQIHGVELGQEALDVPAGTPAPATPAAGGGTDWLTALTNAAGSVATGVTTGVINSLRPKPVAPAPSSSWTSYALPVLALGLLGGGAIYVSNQKKKRAA